MSVDREDSRWMCGRSGMVNLQLVSSLMKEIRDPCLQHSPALRRKMLKPEKWQAIFDSEGKVIGLGKALKLIVLGGVDPSIRAEVWEFLLGCYAVSSTSEYRKQLRIARRERYDDLIKQCQMMHSSVGTGNLAYAVGSKVMDVRTSSKENGNRKFVRTDGEDAHDSICKGVFSNKDNGHADSLYSHHRKSSSDSAELVSAKMNTNITAYNCHLRSSGGEVNETQFDDDSFYDFLTLPVTNLFQKDNTSVSQSKKLAGNNFIPENAERLNNDHVYCFQTNSNVNLIMEAEVPSASTDRTNNNHSNLQRHVKCSNESVEIKVSNELRIIDAPEAGIWNETANEGRVSEWLWTLHRIVVDVVRTDSHLDFYGDTKNMARMSDILAVYAWVDPATGYCQGMSDLLSPFVVLFEDNADAFWCFEMLLRRMRENFQMEGPTGVMKQLQALWKILELTDFDIFQHLSFIGAESLHFAFRMLLVLFRRELSFDDALRMWEMIWAADFNESLCQQLENNCLEPLVLHLRRSPSVDVGAEERGKGKRKLKSTPSQLKNGEIFYPYIQGVRSISVRPFCGLAKTNFWSRNEKMPLVRNSDGDLPVFCVAAILINNQQKIFRETHSIDDIIKMFNDNLLKINVKRCIRMAIKLRKKYFYKLSKQSNLEMPEQ